MPMQWVWLPQKDCTVVDKVWCRNISGCTNRDRGTFEITAAGSSLPRVLPLALIEVHGTLVMQRGQVKKIMAKLKSSEVTRLAFTSAQSCFLSLPPFLWFRAKDQAGPLTAVRGSAATLLSRQLQGCLLRNPALFWAPGMGLPGSRKPQHWIFIWGISAWTSGSRMHFPLVYTAGGFIWKRIIHSQLFWALFILPDLRKTNVWSQDHSGCIHTHTHTH